LKNLKKKENKKDNTNDNKTKKDNIILKDVETNEKLSTCIGREISLALNSKEVREIHESKFGKKVYTRFPPEPNGYLHIGHAKAMRFSFTMAQESGGLCYLRYDDTNPNAESKEYIDNILDCVRWLGYEPWKITYASDNFEQLYEYAKILVQQGHAYVDKTESEKMKEERYNCIESSYRNNSIETNIIEFNKMYSGEYKENEATLRLKIDMKHNNPTLRDPVAYRTINHPHPRTGDKWKI